MANADPPSKPQRGLLILLLVALGLRLAWGLSQPVEEDAMFRSLPDQRDYLLLGRSLLDRGTLAMTDPRFGEEVRAFRPPGYPIFVAICGGHVRTVRVVQALLDTSTVLAVVLLGSRWMSPAAALLAGWIVAVHPFLVFFTSLVLTETVFTAFLVWGMTLLACSGQGPPSPRSSPRWWVGLALLAAAVNVRPTAAPLVAILAVSAAYLLKRDVGGRAVWMSVAGVAVTAGALLPWAVRNRFVLGEWVWTSTNSGFTLYDGLHPAADGSSNQSFVFQHPELATLDEVGRSRHLAGLARRWAWENPADVARLAVRKLLRTWSLFPLSQEYGGRLSYVIAGTGFTLPFFLLVLAGTAVGRLPAAAKVFLLLPAIYFSVVHAVTVGSLRYRLPADPPMAILAAAAVARSRIFDRNQTSDA
ncbi:MAG: glycosyltransferase family 39 protein [Phycisphaerae bacterium]|nr:glycosyltransferase family 39 protein [Phycisphaerae bacterium]MDW8262748.1 glycosyltransferase family 39 protein [Phycisphaerales bacterium]